MAYQRKYICTYFPDNNFSHGSTGWSMSQAFDTHNAAAEAYVAKQFKTSYGAGEYGTLLDRDGFVYVLVSEAVERPNDPTFSCNVLAYEQRLVKVTRESVEQAPKFNVASIKVLNGQVVK